mgnify:CR=1 FL=1
MAEQPPDVKGTVILGDNLPVLMELPDECIDLIYVDPPFNTGKRQTLSSIRTIRDDVGGDRVGFQGSKYRTIQLGTRRLSGFLGSEAKGVQKGSQTYGNTILPHRLSGGSLL